MPLTLGTRLGPYEITGPLGKGGMGEVYRAKDTKLDREVAIKVLPNSLARDHDRLARFEREAKVLASLNHPNIATIYSLEESPEGKAIAMELVDGATLESPLPLDTALNYAKQIAEALEAAHEKSVTHRDLKPANIMVTPAGLVKVLDFGLAAVARPDVGQGEDSPTLTMGMTEAGMIMGTAAYMAPEQATGSPVDKRADIWSFGVVLWQMLTGKHLFSGNTTAHILASVIKDPIDFATLPDTTPALIRELLKRCLDRDVKTRLQVISEARIAIQRHIANPMAEVESLSAPSRSRFGAGWGAWVVAALALIAAVGAGWRVWSAAPVEDKPMALWSVDLGPEAVRTQEASAVLSPDGTTLVFVGRAEGGQSSQLFLRRTDQPEAVALKGTVAGAPAMAPFFSPDGKWIAYFRNGVLMKIPVAGGSPIQLGPAPTAAAHWGDDDYLYLGSTGGLFRYPAGDGPLQNLEPDLGQSPYKLPGTNVVLYRSGVGIQALLLDTKEVKSVIPGGARPRYLQTPDGTGYLIYTVDQTVFGVRFDPKKLAVLGSAVQLLTNVDPASFTISDSGAALYMKASGGGTGYPVSSLDAAGKLAPLVGQSGTYGAPRVSADGQRVAYVALGPKGYDVWVYDVARATAGQVTFLGNVNREIAWARDSKHLVYGDGSALWWVRADGAGQPQVLVEKMNNPRPGSFAPDGRLAFAPSAASNLPDVWTVPIDLKGPEHPKAGKAEPFLGDPNLVEADPAFSPDGKFIAYASSEEGPEQVFVRPFPGPGGRWKVSVNGGKFPVWVGATHELLFLGGDDKIQAASYTVDADAFSVRAPRVWSPTAVRRKEVQQSFDVFPDGKRAVVFPRETVQETGGNLHATLVLNFFDEVRRRVR
ncbi:MAG: protein kinase [Acidobacteriota bacterium]